MTEAEAGPPVGLPAGTGLARAVPARAAAAKTAEKKYMLSLDLIGGRW